jgi:hypothetical protein
LSTRFSPMTARPISPISDKFMSLGAKGWVECPYFRVSNIQDA